MYRKILVPVTLEDEVRVTEALRVAKLLVDPDGAIRILHVAEAMPEYARSHLPAEVLEENRRQLRDRLAAIAAGAGAGVVAELVDGHGGRTIVDHAERQGFDCIVIRSHRPVFGDNFFGSTAAWVVRHAPCSVHVIR